MCWNSLRLFIIRVLWEIEGDVNYCFLYLVVIIYMVFGLVNGVFVFYFVIVKYVILGN